MMRNMLLAALALTTLAATADAKNTGNRTVEATKSRETWAMLKTGDVRLMAFVDRDSVVTDGGATIVLTGQPSENVTEIIVDVELLYAKDHTDARKVVRTRREKIAVDANTHMITIPVGEKKLDSYSILVRVADTSQDPDDVDSTIRLADNTNRTIVLALGRK
jgi:hypothetical protein